MMIVIALWCVAILLAAACMAVALVRTRSRAATHLWRMPRGLACRARCGTRRIAGSRAARDVDAAARPALDRRAFPARRARGLLPRGHQSRRCRRQPVRAGLRPPRGVARTDPAVLSGLPCRHEPRGARRRRVHVPRRVGVHVALVLRARDGAPSRSGEHPRRIHLSRDGGHRHARAAARLRRARGQRRRLFLRGDPRDLAVRDGRGVRVLPRAVRRRLQGRARAAACLAAARSSGGARATSRR